MADDSKKYSDKLDAILERKIRNILADSHVCLPAKITRYDYTLQQADCKPMIKRRFRDGTTQNLPVIPNVPVVFPRFTNGYFYYPVQVGDNVLLIFADYSLDNWAFSNQETDPEDIRAHNISDAFAIVGAYDFNHPISDLANDDDIVVKIDKFKIVIKGTGKIQIINTTDNVDLVTEVYNLAAGGDAATVTITDTGSGNPQTVSLNNKATFTTIKAALAKIKV